MPKSTLVARQRDYDRTIAGAVVRGNKTSGASSLAFHKPGSNKK